MSDIRYEKIGSPITKMIEECAESIHILCKAERFGLDNFHPDDENRTKNRVLIVREIFDVKRAMRNLEDFLTVDEMTKSRKE